MGSSRPLFQLRKELDSSIATLENDVTADNSSIHNDHNTSEYMSSLMESSSDHHPAQTKFNNIKILTENDKYIVKRLTPDLSLLPVDDTRLEGTIDTQLGKALINDADYLYIWDYYSNQKNANFCRIPLHEDYAVLNAAPKCIFTRPSAMDDSMQMFSEGSAGSSGGVCIIHRKNSQFIYYEDIDSINNLHLQLSKNKAHTLSLNLKDDEVVTLVMNSEPAGIVVATSFGRLLFVTIRDSTGRPQVKVKQQLIKSQRGFLFHSFNTYKEIISLKKGPIVGRGERLMYVVTKGGDFQMWHLSVGINSFKRIEVNLFQQILESLQDLYPFAHGSLQILESHPLFPDSSSAHLILSSIENDKVTYYILSTIILDEKTGSFSIFSTYRLNTYVSPIQHHRPKLYVPGYLGVESKPLTTVFVLFSDAVVLTQVSSTLDSSYPLRRKWEDIISFRHDVSIVGSGYSSDSLYIISKNIGVLEISLTEKGSSEDLDDLRFIKSHIDQAVYFSDIWSNPIEFNLPKGLSLEGEEIEDDLKLSSDEIFFSTGKYIPPMLNTLVQHLSLRVELYKNLLNFASKNFNYKISPYAKLDLLEKYEIMNCCLRLFDSLEKSKDLEHMWENTLSSSKDNPGIEGLVCNQLDKFPQLFSGFLTQIASSSLSSKSIAFKSDVVDMLSNCVYEATLEQGEKQLRYGEFKLDPLELNKTLPWLIDFGILNSINDIFFDYKFSSETSVEDNERLIVLVKIMYYLFNQAKLWFDEDETRESSRLYHEILDLFIKNHLSWIQALCELNLQELSLQIAEFYHDMEALVEALETLDTSVSRDTYTHFFDKFGYEFAETLFKHYIEQNKLKDLFNRFPEQHGFLVQFLESSKQYGDVAWIQEILDEKFHEASDTLGKISVGEAGIGKSIEERQLHLSIAKLSALADDDEYLPQDKLNRIQVDLDIIDGQNNLHNKIVQQNVKIESRYLDTVLESVFNSLATKVKAQESIGLDFIIEMYSMLDDADGFYCALKLLAFEKGALEYEKRKILISMVWRRCILAVGNWSKVTDVTQSSFYHVLCRYFQEELYRSDCPLPSYNLICDKSLLNEEYLADRYEAFTANIGDIGKCLQEELKSVHELGKGFETRIKSIIGSANESTGNKCAVNYDSNIVEFH